LVGPYEFRMIRCPLIGFLCGGFVLWFIGLIFLCVFGGGGGVLSVENGPLVPLCNVQMANLLLLHILSVYIGNWIRS
jgi:hypothetical protein